MSEKLIGCVRNLTKFEKMCSDETEVLPEFCKEKTDDQKALTAYSSCNQMFLECIENVYDLNTAKKLKLKLTLFGSSVFSLIFGFGLGYSHLKRVDY